MSDNERDTSGQGARPATVRLSPAEASAKRADRRSLFVLVAIAALLVGAVGLSLASHWDMLTQNGLGLRQVQPGVAETGAPAANAAVAAPFIDRIAALEQRLAGLETSTTGSQPEAPALDDMKSLLTAIDTRLTGLEARIASLPGNDSFAALQDRIARLESETVDARVRRAAATLALANLARAADMAIPFKPELDALAAIAPEDPAIAELAPLADSSTPSLGSLRDRFPDAARAAIEAERESTADEGFFARVWASLGRIVSVRRIGDASGTTTDDRLARAGADLDRNDLASAVGEVKAIAGSAAETMAPWTRNAEARLALDRAVEGMNARIVQALVVPPPGTTGR